MTAPQIIARALTFHFAQSVSTATGRPDIMQVSIIPLNDGTSATAGAVFAGGLKSAEISLSEPSNSVVFSLIPSNFPGLTVPIKYRVMWRAGPQSRTFTYDFLMPDLDLSWEALLSDVSNLITGDVYLQQVDLGVPGRVARLDSQGRVIDSSGVPVASSDDVTAVNNSLGVEVLARNAADTLIRHDLEAELTNQVQSTLSTGNTYTDNQIFSVNSDLNVERASRIDSDLDLQTQVTFNRNNLQSEIDSLSVTSGGVVTTLANKADLDGTGHVPVAQIPEEILTSAVAVPNQVAMLALTYPTVHKGNLAIRPDGVFLLTTNDPSTLSNWVSLTTVSSVNTQRGIVILTASDVGAIPVGGSVAQNQVTGLATALGLKANQSDLVSVTNSLQSIQSDMTYVHTVSGIIPTSLMSTDMVYLNSTGQIVRKDGTIIPVGTSGGSGAVFSVNTKVGAVVLTASDVGAIPTGGAITQAQITGLTTTLAGKADLVSSLVPLNQIPNLPQSQITGLTATIAAKADLVSGLIPLGEIPSIPQSQVTGLPGLVSGNQLTTGTNAVNRIASLEGRATALESGGGSGGGGTSSTTVFYDSSNVGTVVTDFTAVTLHSPWGIDSDGSTTGTTGTRYYLHYGVVPADVAYPYITANGHLSLRKWNEAGAADAVYALQSDLATTNTLVATKANQTDLTALTNVVATKASQTALTTLSTTVDTKATSADLTSLATTVAGKANQSDLNTTNTTVASKANQSDLTALTTTVGNKADQSALNTTNAVVAGHTTALTAKADLVGGVVPLSQVPTNIAQSSVSGLSTALGNKADLTAGKVPISQVPSIPQSQVTGLSTSLGSKADLVGGFVPMSQLPLSALPNVVVVANRAAMLALTSATVQYGDLVIITGTSDKGTYVLTGSDPSVFSNWTSLTTPDAPVTSVNSQTGAVTLAAADVGALASNAAIPISQVTGLQTQLSSFATSASVTSGLAAKTSASDVQGILTLSSFVKHADYAATSAVTSLGGAQSVDGVLVASGVGTVVLLTAQSSSVNNGLWCADEQTEILTRSGYKRHENLEEGEEVLTFNVSTGLSEWEPVQSVHRFPVNDVEMLSMETASHSSLTTLDHRWPVRRRRNNAAPGYAIRRSHELNDSDALVRAALAADLPQEAKYADALVELVGWFFTEGYIRREYTRRDGSKSLQSTGVRITQSYEVNPENVYRIRGALSRIFGAASPRRSPGRPRKGQACAPRWTEALPGSPGMTQFSLNASAGAILCNLAPNKVASMDFIHSLTEAQLRLFVDTCIAADGHVNRTTGMRSFIQKSAQRLEPFQVACTLLGIATTQSKQPTGHGSEVFVLTLCERRRHIQPQRHGQRVSYTGTVWCPKTANGTWFARRNGSTYFTGNTVNTSAWTRPADFATSSYLARDTIIIVTNSSAGAAGAANANTIYQMTTSSGFIDTNVNNWTRIGYAAPPFSATAGNGISITGTTFAVNPATSGGLQVTSGGVSVDPNLVARKTVQTVPSGSTVASVTHNLNSYQVQVSIWDTASNTLVLAGVTATTANTISIEFASTVMSGQYKVMIAG